MSAIPGFLGPTSLDVVGTTLCRATVDEVYYTPWEGTQTEAATFVVVLVAKMTNVHVDVVVETKDEDETTPTTSATISFTTETPPSVKPGRGTPLKALFRYKVTIKNASGCATMRFLQPSWERR